MNLPTIEEVEQLWDSYRVPPNIRGHMRQVAKVAVFLAKMLKEKGIHVDAGLVERSALLHDLARAANFDDFGSRKDPMEDVEFWKQMHHKFPNTHHGDIAADALSEKYPEIADIIRAHTTDNESGIIEGWSWEMKLLVYADSRVLHERIVSRSERDSDADKRHGKFYQSLKKRTGIDFNRKIRENLNIIEREIFGKLEIAPEDVNNID